MRRIVRFSSMTTLMFACSAGGAGSLVDAGPSTGDRPDAAPPTQPEDAGRRGDAAPASSGPVSCARLCANAVAALGSSCDGEKCEAQCAARADQASVSCASEWDAFLECAVLGGKVTGCAFNGKLSITRCDDEERALTVCLNKPKTCASTCTSDVQCQQSCPTTSGAMSCCDRSTGTCYLRTGSMCPSFQGDGGFIPSY